MRSETHEQFGTTPRWIHVSAWVMIVAIVVFVRLYLKAGRKWLAWTIVAVRTLSLILNFVLSPNINYRKITALRHIPFLGESVSVPAGVPNPWMLMAQLSLLLLVIFVVDATITVWRRGEPQAGPGSWWQHSLVRPHGDLASGRNTWGIIYTTDC